ncbi:hypothetical protein PCARR_a3784 [Pseudoalteromonas carrageenovora IAM 12662]|uniref:Uncharacterized protein n=1 Tax=Pseudoalteromonas carrageenovora IAM 12662 TaxID=1314868 RepID=A0ABR9EMX3_PSEVC|nr:hypothetical protein [Pseudoalteromonas carrageenovora IAM 12662]
MVAKSTFPPEVSCSVPYYKLLLLSAYRQHTELLKPFL